MRRYGSLPLRPGDYDFHYFWHQEKANRAAEILAHRLHVAIFKFYRSHPHEDNPKEVEHVQGVVSDSNQCVAQTTAFTRAGREIIHPDPAGDAVCASAGGSC